MLVEISSRSSAVVALYYFFFWNGPNPWQRYETPVPYLSGCETCFEADENVWIEESFEMAQLVLYATPSVIGKGPFA
jgi:hypothetical protein